MKLKALDQRDHALDHSGAPRNVPLRRFTERSEFSGLKHFLVFA